VFVTLNIYFDNVDPDPGNLLCAIECFELDFLPAELGPEIAPCDDRISFRGTCGEIVRKDDLSLAWMIR
jgi:hypothetical protein